MKKVKKELLLATLKGHGETTFDHSGKQYREGVNSFPSYPSSTGGGGGVSSWNDLTDKPFYEETTPGINIEWDGNTEGRTVVVAGEDQLLVKVSDELPSNEQLLGATILAHQFGEEMSQTLTQEVFDQWAGMGAITDDYTAVSNVFVIRVPNCTISGLTTATFSEPGVYFPVMAGGGVYVKSLTKPGSTVIHKLDEKYLPETAATKEYVEEVILGGAW